MKDPVVERALALAKVWQESASENISDFENHFHVKMEKMLNNPIDKVFLIELMDQCFRSQDVSRVENQIEYLFSKYGMATFFTDAERFLVFLFRHAGTYLPQISIPLFVDNIRRDTKTVVLQGEEKALNKHLKSRRKEDIRVNVNLIGEVVLGEKEAEERLEKYLKALENPHIDYLSVKISTLYSQIKPIAFNETVDILTERLVRLFKQAKKYPFQNKQGEMENKFINLDMEEYRDLAITVASFKKALENPELRDYKAGIVLQAYLPDSHIWQKELTEWAKMRVDEGGSPIKVRLVKGANMEMEETESSLKHWPIAPYRNKIDTDSNYKVMAKYAMEPENIKAVNLGMASHNLFELAYGFELAKENDVLDYFSIEMLEGMSESARVAISKISGRNVILYAPTAGKDQFTNAIAYLVRRLDENTSEENFIRYSFGLKTTSSEWEMLKKAFLDSFENIPNLFIGQHRNQNRANENWSDFKGGAFYKYSYTPEADTDFILKENQDWAKEIVKTWQKKKDDDLFQIPVVFAGEDHRQEREVINCLDKSQAKEEVFCGQYTKAKAEDLEKAAEVAASDPDGWRDLSFDQRHELLSKVANNVRQRRADLIGVAAAEVGKVFTETDVEVSEAVDFLEFYGQATRYFKNFENLKLSGKGVGLVTPPWNFPIAIPLGGVTAALAAGNTVILKPASDAVMCGYELCKCFWDAGISKNTLQFVPCPGSLAGKHLVENEKVDFVILTGGEDTAMRMLEARPNLFLTAETGGKDATIVTAMSDREQAIANVVQSAFGNSGQKCSATSLLILENEVYFDRKFQEALADATQSLSVGSVWDLKNSIGTLANKVSGDLKEAITKLDDGESWLVKPEFQDGNEYMLKPSIKWGVKPGSYSHMTEFFGPVLSVMRADDLEHAVNLVNQTGYGLTSGIESLDEREVNYWRKNIRAGNLYINRGTTGAIVLRQPFGGMGKSAIGAGRKVGVYNYLTQFMKIEDQRIPDWPRNQVSFLSDLLSDWQSSPKFPQFEEDFQNLKYALHSYLYNYKNEFTKEHDFFKLRGEDNIFKYLPLKKIAVRVSSGDNLFCTMSRLFAAKICGVDLHVSVDESMNDDVSRFLFTVAPKILGLPDKIRKESEEDFVKVFPEVERVLYAGEENISDFIFSEAAKKPLFIVREKPLMEGRIELLNYFEEQSISHSYHRYGNLGAKGLRELGR